MRPLKYNPAFMTDEELLESFCVRQHELDALVACVREKSGANDHVLITGVRGSGKTMLLRCLVAEIRKDAELSATWHPVTFAEENYEILSLDDLWLQTLYYLSTAAYEELQSRGGRDPDSEERGLAHILDFSDHSGKRILLICENLNDLFDTLPAEDILKLRRTLESERRIKLIGSATTSFDSETGSEHPFRDFFKTIPLKRLPREECQRLWFSVAGKKITSYQARALEILTGGSPRLLSVLAWFGKDLSFVELMKELEMLIDDHTDYFKGQMEALPPKERKVFATLARLWTNSSSAEVAGQARMEQTETASLLSRLVKRGIVEEFPPEGRKKRGKTYQLSERLFNIYYLMRLGGRSYLWVRPVVEFLAQVFGADVTEELYQLDYACLDKRTLRYAGMLMSAVDFGETIDRQAVKLFENGDIEQALEITQKAYKLQALALGEEHPAVLNALNHMATGCLVIGKLDEALDMAQRAHAGLSRVLGESDTETLCALGNVTNIYAAMGDYCTSLELTKQLFTHVDFMKGRLQYANMMCVTLAAMSPEVAGETLAVIENSPSSEVLYALSAGIKAYLGIEFRAPQEVRDIAADIKSWIEKMVASQEKE